MTNSCNHPIPLWLTTASGATFATVPCTVPADQTHHVHEYHDPRSGSWVTEDTDAASIEVDARGCIHERNSK